MTNEEFTTASISILRSAVGWQTAIARRLGVEPRTVRRWLAAGATPEWVDEKFAAWKGLADLSPWPRDEWMLGDARMVNGGRREFIAHMQPPRFFARVVAVDDDGIPEPAEQPADTLSGVVYASGDYVLCEVDWVDQPTPGEVAKWLEAAADYIDGEDGL